MTSSKPLMDAPPCSAGAEPTRCESDVREPIDARVLARLIGDDAAMLDDFFADFARSAAEAAASLDQALAARSRDQAVSCAHRLRGSSRSVGAARLGELCARIEAACRDADEAVLKEPLALFHAELLRVQRWIGARNSGAPGALQDEVAR